MKTLAIVMVVTIASATLIANLGYGDQVFAFLRYVPGGDLTGHFGLYALLGFALTSWVSRPTRAETRSARIRITAVLAILVSLEEVCQSVIPARTFSLLDMTASVFGLVAGLLVATLLAGARGANDAD